MTKLSDLKTYSDKELLQKIVMYAIAVGSLPEDGELENTALELLDEVLLEMEERLKKYAVVNND